MNLRAVQRGKYKSENPAGGTPKEQDSTKIYKLTTNAPNNTHLI